MWSCALRLTLTSVHLLFGFTSRGAVSNTANHANSDVTSDGLRAQRVRRYTLFFSKPGGEAKYCRGVREFGHRGQGFPGSHSDVPHTGIGWSDESFRLLAAAS